MSDVVLAAVLASAYAGLYMGVRRTRPGGGWSAAAGTAGLFLALLVARILLDRGHPIIGLVTAAGLGLAWIVLCLYTRRIRYRAF